MGTSEHHATGRPHGNDRAGDLRQRFYRHAMDVLDGAGVPFLVGGAFALRYYTDIVRDTKDFDVFVEQDDLPRALDAFRAAGYSAELTFPHWLGKAFSGDAFVDVIFSSANGVARVDRGWFEHAPAAQVLGRAALVLPVEEMFWSKAFIMERERFDGADIVHLLHAHARQLDWRRLVNRFGPNWRVLLAHLVLFGFVYPAERTAIPGWVLADLTERLSREQRQQVADDDGAFRGTLISREQYLVDVDQWGRDDARIAPQGSMSPEDVAHWTAAIDTGE